jgi:aspartate/methionine/tyrosine aminotransferase
MYLAKFALAEGILGAIPGVTIPQAGFFLWLPVPDGEAAALRLWREAGVRVLPGAYLAREVAGLNPGQGYIRVALVGDDATLARGLGAIAHTLYGIPPQTEAG